MVDLATEKAAETGLQFLFLLLLLLPALPLHAQTGPAQFLLIIRKNDREMAVEKELPGDIYKTHRENLQQLLSGGYLTMAGVLKRGGGIFYGREEDQTYIRTVLEKDLIISSGMYTFTIRAYDEETGYVCPFQNGCVETGYLLIKFLTNLNKETVKIAADMEYQHQLYIKNAMKQGRVLFSGRFDGKDGDFVIYRDGDFNNFAYENPAVVNNYLMPEFFHFTGCSPAGCTAPE